MLRVQGAYECDIRVPMRRQGDQREERQSKIRKKMLDSGVVVLKLVCNAPFPKSKTSINPAWAGIPVSYCSYCISGVLY